MIQPAFTIGDVTVYCPADCAELLPKLPPQSVDAIITDPPYAISTAVASGRNVTRNVGDLSLIEYTFRSLFTEFRRVLKHDGRMFIFCDGTSYPVIYRAAYGQWGTADLVWNKGQAGMGREFRKAHELILHAWLPDTPIVDSNGQATLDVLPCPPVPASRRVHPAQKPVPLLIDLLRVCGGVILDPFTGSGSTACACMKTGRQFIGCEIEAEYLPVIKRRLKDAATPLLESCE